MSYGPSRTMKNVLVVQANSGRIAMGHKGVEDNLLSSDASGSLN